MSPARRLTASLLLLAAAGCAAPMPATPPREPDATVARPGPVAGTSPSPLPAPLSAPLVLPTRVAAIPQAVVPISFPTRAPGAPLVTGGPATGATTAPATGGPTAAPAAIASGTPTGPGAEPFHEGGVVFVKPNPFGLPRAGGFALPAGLRAVAGGQAPAAYATMAAPGIGEAAAFLLGINLVGLFQTMALIEAVFAGATAIGLQPDQVVTWDDEHKPGKKLTVQLTLQADHATITVYRGAAVDPAQRMIAVTYTDPLHGRAVFRTLDGEGDPERIVISESYDLARGIIVADGAFDDPANAEGIAQRTRTRWELSRPTDDPRGAVFSLRAALTGRKANDPKAPESFAFAADFAAGGAGAHWIKVRNAGMTNGPVFLPADGYSWGAAPPAPYGFAIDGAGRDLPFETAPAEVRGLLPPVDTTLPPFPPDPAASDMFADPRLAFPD